MKKTIVSTVLLLMFTIATFAAGFEGTWNAKMKGQDGSEMDLSFVFKKDGDKLTGAIKTGNGDMPISNIKVEDKVLTFEIEFGDMKIKQVFTQKDDDTISGKAEGSPMGDSEMILKRQK